MPTTNINPQVTEQAEELVCSVCDEISEESTNRTMPTTNEYNGENICEVCYDNEYITCPSCTEVTHLDDTRAGTDDTLYCDRCWNEHFTYCAYCDEPEQRDHVYHSNENGLICRDCVNNGEFDICPRCNDAVHYESTERDEFGDSYCFGCIDNHKPDTIHSYSYRPAPLFHRVIAEENITSMNDGGETHFGIELEIDSKEHIPNKETLAGDIAGKETDFYCKSDSSLDYGFEIVSHPVTFEYFKKNKEKFQKVLKDSQEFGFRSHDAGTCGMHVHVSKDGISNLQLFKIMDFIFSNPSFIRVISNRTASQLETWASVDIARLVGGMEPEEKVQKLSNLAKRKSGGGRVAINIQNEKTVEFRIFRGTLNWKTYQKNIQFVHSVVEFTKNNGLRNFLKENTLPAYLDFLANNQNEYQELCLFIFNRFFSFEAITKGRKILGTNFPLEIKKTLERVVRSRK